MVTRSPVSTTGPQVSRYHGVIVVLLTHSLFSLSAVLMADVHESLVCLRFLQGCSLEQHIIKFVKLFNERTRGNRKKES